MLFVHRSDRADGLADALGDLLLVPLSDPFGAEVVSVPARGMERWLTQRLSARLGARPGREDGVCANIDFPSPHQLIGDAVALASGIDPGDDPWRPERSVWPLLEVVETSLDEAWAASLAAYLGHGVEPPEPHRRARRLSTVRHLAELFSRYALQRPEMVLAWSRGLEAAPSSASWQAELWRRLNGRIGTPNPAERLATACEALRRHPALLRLPERVSLFGITRLPAGYVNVLQALAAERDVNLMLLHPSPALWDSIAALDAIASAVPRRSADPTAELPTNPLLRSWGRDARELQLVVGGRGESRPAAQRPDAPATLLARLQADVRADRRPPGPPLPDAPELRPLLAADDRSLQVHACHGRARQVEVVRTAILHALAADETLEPRDVIVMCPDIETFAPLIHATFGIGNGAFGPGENSLARILEGAFGAGENSLARILEGGVGVHAPLPRAEDPDLRVRLADRSLRQTNPLLGVISELLELSGRRVTASEVLDLADREPIRRRFRLDDDSVSRIQGWVADAGIRWGLDAEHRAPFKLAGVANGTWRTGLDRLLLGVTMTEDEQRLMCRVLPLDDVDSGSIDLAGRLIELIARLGRALDGLSNAQPVAAWARSIAFAADSLTATSPRDSWQRAQLQRILDDLVDEAAGSGTALSTIEVRALLAERLQGRPTRANFRTGHLTVCTLVPMRSVPHRIVCLLGLDDGAFPRKAPRDGDDVMLEAPLVGERDPRSEDRQLLLDALMAAGEQLIVTYSGNDERTNAVQPPAVPVGELLDVAEATVSTAAGTARDQVLVRHPLQPFDPRNFTPGALVRDTTWSFDRVTLEGARASTAPRSERRAFLTAPLPPLHPRAATFELEDLLRFVRHPVKAFLRRRLSVGLGDYSDELEDDLRVELDGLERWDVGQKILDARLAGIDGRSAWLAAIARGDLPPGELGRPVLTKVYAMAESIFAVITELIEVPRRPADVHIELPDSRTLTGTVPDVSGETLISGGYSRLAAKHRIAAWVRLLALTLAAPEHAFTAVTVGRVGGDGVGIQRIRPLGETPGERREVASEQLTAVLDLYERGMREPLPLFCGASAAYAEASASGADPVAAAGKAWTTDFNFDGEDAEPEHQLVLGGKVTLDRVMREPPGSTEHGAGWDPSETTRFGRLAHRMWDGLLEFEALS